MLALYIILVLNNDSIDTDIYKFTYNLAYMDNLAYSSSSEDKLFTAFESTKTLFKSYGFKLQKYCTNSNSFQKILKAENLSTEENIVDLFGLKWDTSEDALMTRPLYLDPNAITLRKVLATLNSVYDPLGINLLKIRLGRCLLRK